MQTSSRGSALIIAVIVVAVLAAIGAGLLRFASRSVAGASAVARREALVNCAEAARALLESRFHALGAAPTSVEALNVPLDGTGGRLRARGGHIDANITVTLDALRQVEELPPNALGVQTSAFDLSNRIVEATTIPAYRVTAHCQEGDLSSDTSGRQMEVEFLVRFGL
jgi:hypothetical protein